jgi:hypothetical protein
VAFSKTGAGSARDMVISILNCIEINKIKALTAIL